jgi:hypothetical protein
LIQIIRAKRAWIVGVVSGALLASLISGLALGVLPSSADDSATSEPPRDDVFVERVDGADRPAPPPPMSPDERQRMRAAFEKFAGCMRNQGVDIPSPPANGEGVMFIQRRAPASGRPSDDELQKLRAAHEQCKQYLPDPPR